MFEWCRRAWLGKDSEICSLLEKMERRTDAVWKSKRTGRDQKRRSVFGLEKISPTYYIGLVSQTSQFHRLLTDMDSLRSDGHSLLPSEMGL